MGVFDFVRDVGAKVGIGKSSDEKKAEDAAEAASAEREKAAKEAKAATAAVAARAAGKLKADREEQAKREAYEAKRKERQEAHEKKAAANRFAAYKKSIELERYVRDELGLPLRGIDIRYEAGTAYIEGEAQDQQTKEKIILAVGNAEGVGRVDEEITVAEPADEAEFHTVETGDTLWAVAERVYGDGNRYPEIFEANKPMLSDPDLIYPGQVLRCPK